MEKPPVPVHRVATLRDNYVWLIEYEAGKVAAVDPGEAAPVLEAARRLKLAIRFILNTHWHADHCGGNLELKRETGCTILGPALERQPIPGMDTALADGAGLALGSLIGTALFVGAHTAGHIAFHFAGAGLLFPGDTLFGMGCGRIFEGTADDLWRALKRLAALPGSTLVYPAHEYTEENGRFALTTEPENAALRRRYNAVQELRARGEATAPFSLAEELATNPFLRARSVAELAERRRAKDAF